MSKILLAAAALVPALGLMACETAKSVNPFAKNSPNQAHCRAALDYLVARETEKTKISVEDESERPRDTLAAVTIVYVQGESRRLFTCLYVPDQPGRLTAGSYRGQALTPTQVDQVNANAGRR